MSNPYPTLLPQDFANYGKVRKTHGHQGELAVALGSEALWEVDPEHLFPIIDEIAIPFQVENIRGNSSQLIIKLKGIDDLTNAEKLVGCELMILKEELTEVHASEEVDIIGYTLIHATGAHIGIIKDLDDSTQNRLLLVDTNCEDSKEVTIPLVNEWVIEISEKDKSLTLNFPIELLGL